MTSNPTVMMVFKVLSYLSLIVVTLAFSTVFALAIYNSCEQLDFSAVTCADAGNQMYGTFAMTTLWWVTRTVVPGLLALAGVYFLVRRMMDVESAMRDRAGKS